MPPAAARTTVCPSNSRVRTSAGSRANGPSAAAARVSTNTCAAWQQTTVDKSHSAEDQGHSVYRSRKPTWFHQPPPGGGINTKERHRHDRFHANCRLEQHQADDSDHSLLLRRAVGPGAAHTVGRLAVAHHGPCL